MKKVCLLLLLFGVVVNLYAYERYNRVKNFDHYFSKYSKRYFGPGFDWILFKAQAVAESRLNSRAKSHAGAKGLMQIMPKTFQEIKKKNPAIKGSNLQPRWNIAAGIYYNFMFGSYNAGKGNILKAQKVAEKKNLNPNRWDSIEKTLPKITGKHSEETINYVQKIHIIKKLLK